MQNNIRKIKSTFYAGTKSDGFKSGSCVGQVKKKKSRVVDRLLSATGKEKPYSLFL